jgi:penicillin-binding protein 1C
MHEVSGVTGAGPILHAIFDHLHATRGTSWYRTPAEIVERNVHPFTGKLLADDDVRGIREKFIAGQLPSPDSAADFDGAGRVLLGSEYGDWFASAENPIRGEATLAANASELRITSPLAGGTYLVDPDVATSGRIPLTALGGNKLIWQSDSLSCRRDGATDYADARDGEHRITVTNVDTGQHAEVQILVHSL